MKVAFLRFLAACLGTLLVLFAGLALLLRTGQVDPLDWAWPAVPLLALVGWLASRGGGHGHARAHAIWVGLGTVLSILLLCRIAAARPPALSLSLLLAVSAALGLCGGLLLRRSRTGAVALIAAALLVPLAGRPPAVPMARQRPSLAVLTALPLFWREGGQGLAAPADAPIVTVLRQHFDLRPFDTPLSPELAKARLLLIAQPRATQPGELVAIDRWLRDGGRALILADPLLRWPSPLAPGDRRRAPAASLLGPLLAHWGVRLENTATLDEERHLLPDGRLMTLLAASHFIATAPACRTEARGLVARCRLGRGQAVLVADADLIDDRLWLADPSRPLDPSAWTADTPALVAGWLGAELHGDRRWVLSGAQLVLAVRWAAVAGIFWAAMGAILFSLRRGRFPPGADPGPRRRKTAKGA